VEGWAGNDADGPMRAQAILPIPVAMKISENFPLASKMDDRRHLT
jgi:hypothetical protein